MATDLTNSFLEDREAYKVFDLALSSIINLPLNRIKTLDRPCWSFDVIVGAKPPLLSKEWIVHTSLDDGTPWMLWGRRGNTLLLRFPAMADFEVMPTQRCIICHASADFPQDTIIHLLLDQVLPRVVAYDGGLVLHASAVGFDQKALAFLGPTGFGKSTLAASLCKLGHALICDDGLYLKLHDQQVMAYPSYPGLRLWQDSAEMIAEQAVISGPVAHYTPKRRVSIGTRSLPFSDDPVALSRVYVLAPAETAQEDITLSPLSKRDAVLAMLSATFRLDLDDKQQNQRDFEAYLSIADQVSFFQLKYPHDFTMIEAVHKAILGTASIV